MAHKTLREFSAPSVANVPTGPTVDTGNVSFELKKGLINMVRSHPFSGLGHEDASAHLLQFLEISNTFSVQGVTQDAIRLRLFPFSLLGKAKQWFYTSQGVTDTWDKCSMAFLEKFFPLGKTNALREKISDFQQASNESIPEAWERLQDYILACPHHGLKSWFIIQNFYHGLTSTSRDHLDAAAGGDFFSLTVVKATKLIEKIASNQGWSTEHLQPVERDLYTDEEVDKLSAKLALLLKYVKERAQLRPDTASSS